MNNDQSGRSAGRIATAIAVPFALAAGFLFFQVLKPAPAPVEETKPSSTPGPVSTAPVALPGLALDARTAATCKEFVDKLPGLLRGNMRREVTGAPEQHAAFGEPAVTVSCGVPQPTFDPADLVYPLNGVCWHPDKTGSVWTTVDREVAVALTLPASQSGEGSGQWAAAVAGSVATIPVAATKPWGCG